MVRLALPGADVGCRCILHRPDHVLRFIRRWLMAEMDEYQGVDRALSRAVIGRLLDDLDQDDPTVSPGEKRP